jgi:hypothetical protein
MIPGFHMRSASNQGLWRIRFRAWREADLAAEKKESAARIGDTGKLSDAFSGKIGRVCGRYGKKGPFLRRANGQGFGPVGDCAP